MTLQPENLGETVTARRLQGKKADCLYSLKSLGVESMKDRLAPPNAQTCYGTEATITTGASICKPVRQIDESEHARNLFLGCYTKDRILDVKYD